MLTRLIYASRADLALRPMQLALIVKQSCIRNQAESLTGGLAFVGGVFLQYLEGPDENVTRTFDRIAHDRRHGDVKVLERRTIARRMFPTWSMSMLSWVDETRDIFKALSPGMPLDLYATDPVTAAPLFRAWAATEHWSDRQLA